MSTPLEDYALLSDLRTGPLVSRHGSVDWLCLPRFDSAAFFAALLGDEDDGRWLLHVLDGEVRERRYLPDTFVLETTWQSPTGVARVTDFLPPSSDHADLVRRVECSEGTVTVAHDLRIRFDYARATPWTRRIDHLGAEALVSIAGPDGLLLSGPLLQRTDGEADAVPGGERCSRLEGSFELAEGETRDWQLTWFRSHEEPPEPADPQRALDEAVAFWADWSKDIEVNGEHADLVRRSLQVLRALTHSQTVGIVAAPTASLPEQLGGVRNWDYRYTWLRDAAFAIEAVVDHGLTHGARQWRDWLLRAIGGDIDDVRIMYGLAGERDLRETELDHLAGYEGSRPVRVGNGAASQFQADVVGEVMVALAQLRAAGEEDDAYSWAMQKGLLDYAEANLDRQDHGIWEMRGDLHWFTHGRAMLWAGFDCGVRAVEEDGLDGPVERWRELREQLRAEIDERGFDPELDSFTQVYGGDEVDASLLQLPHFGFCAYDDPRMLGTVARIERDLMDEHGLILRYRTEAGMDGLEGHEHPFLLCNFWLVEQHARSGRRDDAERLMAQLVGYANDLGLMSEEYDPGAKRLIGNFPQAFSHLALIRAADALRLAARDGD